MISIDLNYDIKKIYSVVIKVLISNGYSIRQDDFLSGLIVADKRISEKKIDEKTNAVLVVLESSSGESTKLNVDFFENDFFFIS